MATLDNILALLNKWPAWKRITESPDRLDQLESRVEQLERKLRREPGEACPRCGERAVRVKEAKRDALFGDLGARKHVVECEECGFSDERLVTPD